MQSDLKYWLAFSEIKPLNPKRFHQLIKRFASLKHAWHASATELATAGFDNALAQELVLRRSRIDPDQMITKLVQNRVQAVTFNDEEYPRLLKEIHEPPPVLYFKGKLMQDEHLLAVVGSRKMSPYGQQTTRRLTTELCNAGVTIVSGLALGIDAQAHEVCVENNMRTIAVLGSGLDTQNIYPTQNRYLAERIIKNNGCLFSEYPLGTPPLKYHFPARNRIIAGICQATLVTEAAQRSGALITAYQALEQNRDIFAVPGNVESTTSKGTNTLIKKGAHVVTQAQDILDVLGIERTQQASTSNELDTTQKHILKILQSNSCTFTELAQKLKMQTKELAPIMSSLELSGHIKNIGGSKYIIAK